MSVNPWKNRASSELLYKSNRPQVSMVYRLINPLGCWKNTRRIRKSARDLQILLVFCQHSVYVSVLKIPIVPADSMSKLLRQKIFGFSRERPLLAREKILYFAKIMDTNRESAHQSQNEDNFATFSLGLEFLYEAEKEKNNGKVA